MTKFVPSFATQQLLPPWNSIGCVRWGFVLEIDQDDIQTYLDKYLNGNFAAPKDEERCAPFVYAPREQLSDNRKQYGILLFAWHPDMSSEVSDKTSDSRDDSKKRFDALSCSEVFFMIPATRTSEIDGQSADTTVWLQPFSFCDNATVVFGSREIWGSDKTYATIKAGKLGNGKLHVDVAMDGVEKFSPTAHSEPLGCIHVRQAPGSNKPLGDLLTGKPGLERFARFLLNEENNTDPRWASHISETHIPAQIQFNNLKQFRDASNMEYAVYRAIVASSAVHSNVEGLVFYEGAKVEVDVMWSDSVREMLKSLFGIKKPKTNVPPTPHRRAARPGAVKWNLPRTRLPVTLAFSLTSNVRFAVIETLYTYTGPATSKPEPPAAASPGT